MASSALRRQVQTQQLMKTVAFLHGSEIVSIMLWWRTQTDQSPTCLDQDLKKRRDLPTRPGLSTSSAPAFAPPRWISRFPLHLGMFGPMDIPGDSFRLWRCPACADITGNSTFHNETLAAGLHLGGLLGRYVHCTVGLHGIRFQRL